MPRPFPAGFAVFRPFRRRVVAWDVDVSMAFAAPAWFPPDANVAEPRFRQSPRLQPPMAVSLTRENRPKGERPKSASALEQDGVSTPNGGKSNAPNPHRIPAKTPLTYLEAWIICLAARLGNQQLDIRVRHAGPRQLPLQFAPPQHGTHPSIWVNGKTASDDRSRCTLARFAAPIALSRGSNTSSGPVCDLGRPGVKFQVPYHWTTRSGAMSTAAIPPRQSQLVSSNSAAAGALLDPCTQICSAYMSGTTLARHGLDGIVSIVEEQRHLPSKTYWRSTSHCRTGRCSKFRPFDTTLLVEEHERRHPYTQATGLH